MLSKLQVRHPFLFLALPLASIFSLTYFTLARAQQVTSDGTVSTTVTTPDGKNFNINDGTRRGGNLFHSFKEFSVPTGGSANFNNAADVRNIIGRVTGGSISSIDGLIRTLGKANLFLLNPAGIIFGPNAQLNMGGSFLGSTANSFVFDNGFEFSATNPQAPPLLTINVPIGLRFRDNPGNITNQSRALDTSTNIFGLAVKQGNSLTLVGGNVSLDGGILFAPGGRVELGGLSAPETVGLNGDGSLSFPVGVQRGDVSLTNRAEVGVSSGGGGSIAVNARNLNISGGSGLYAGIRQGSRIVGSQAGDITLDATGDIKVVGSNVFNNVRSQALGNAGNINITTGSLSLTDGAQIGAITLGQGNAGNVSVRALGNVDLAGSNTTIFSTVEAGGVGKGSNIDIKGATLSLKDGAQLSASTSGQGNAGNVTVDITGSITIVGVNDTFPSGILSTVQSTSVGDGGNIKIKGASLSLQNGAQLLAIVRGGSDNQPGGRGNAGNVTIDVTGPVTIAGVKNGSPSGIGSSVGTGAKGNGGNIAISSGSFSLSDGAILEARTFGQGNAGSVSVRALGAVELAGNNTRIFSTVEPGAVGKGGNIDINAATLSLKDGAQLLASTYGQGNAGNVSVRASGAVDLAGSNTAILSAVEAGGVGKGGNIDINAASFSLKDGAQLVTVVREKSDTQPVGRGDAGNVTVDVTGPVTIAGVGVKSGNPSAIFSQVNTGATGNGGNIAISSGSFSLSDSGRLSASTAGQGNAGNVSVRATNSVELAGSNTRIFSTVEPTAVGNGGKININAPRVSLNDRAQVTASSTGKGAAGDIEVLARSIRLDNNSIINADSKGGQGNIYLSARYYVLLRRGSKITTNATGLATGGNIEINAGNLVAFPQENSDITAKAQQSSGGRITINTKGGIFGIEYRPQETPLSDITASSDLGLQFSGIVQINTPDIDPTQGLFELTETVIDPAQQIAQNPCIKGFGSTFTITGRGGLPTDPNKVLSSDNVRVDLIKPVATTVSSTSATQKQPSQKPSVKEIIPAQGWIYNEKGEVVLVAYDPTKTGPQRQQPAPTSSCAAVK